jgi:hypothetical protein
MRRGTTLRTPPADLRRKGAEPAAAVPRAQPAAEAPAEVELVRERQRRLLELLGGDDCFGPCSTGDR